MSCCVPCSTNRYTLHTPESMVHTVLLEQFRWFVHYIISPRAPLTSVICSIMLLFIIVQWLNLFPLISLGKVASCWVCRWGYYKMGCQIWHPNWVRLAPNQKNLGLFKISFSTFWLGEPQCTESDLKGSGPICMSNLTSLLCKCWHFRVVTLAQR